VIPAPKAQARPFACAHPSARERFNSGPHHVHFGSATVIAAPSINVRSSPQSRHSAVPAACSLCAKSGHSTPVISVEFIVQPDAHDSVDCRRAMQTDTCLLLGVKRTSVAPSPMFALIDDENEKRSGNPLRAP